MKKSLLALAAIGFAGAAAAQSSVTLGGIVDAAYAHVSAGGRSASGITNSGINSSRLYFRGVEDLGGGLKAGFWLEGQLANDVGYGGSQSAGLDFRRRSTVSLMGDFGELRLGRDYTPSFWNTTVYDPFGTNGVGQAMTPNLLGAFGLNATNTANAVGNGSNAVRANNTIAYFLPGNLGGFNGQFQVGFGENTGGVKTNNYVGFRVGYAAGPLSAHYAYGNTKGATSAADVKYNNVGLSYDMGAVKPMFVWAQEKAGSGAKVTGMEFGLVAPVGAGELRAALSRYDVANSSDDWNKLALGYVHNLSKRTALYATFARVSNKGKQTMDVSNNGLRAAGAALLPAGQAGWAAPGGSSTGYEFGVRHAF